MRWRSAATVIGWPPLYSASVWVSQSRKAWPRLRPLISRRLSITWAPAHSLASTPLWRMKALTKSAASRSPGFLPSMKLAIGMLATTSISCWPRSLAGAPALASTVAVMAPAEVPPMPMKRNPACSSTWM